MREELANELSELINELGPKLWDDFNHVRDVLLWCLLLLLIIW